jgi:hypothetical protein
MADNTKRFELSRQNSATAPPSTLPPGTSVTVIPAAARLLQKGTLLRILVFVAFGCCSGFFWFGLRIIFRENDYELAGWLLCCGFAFAIIQRIVQEIIALLTCAKFGRLTELKPSKPAPWKGALRILISSTLNGTVSVGSPLVLVILLANPKSKLAMVGCNGIALCCGSVVFPVIESFSDILIFGVRYQFETRERRITLLQLLTKVGQDFLSPEHLITERSVRWIVFFTYPLIHQNWKRWWVSVFGDEKWTCPMLLISNFYFFAAYDFLMYGSKLAFDKFARASNSQIYRK